VFGDGFGVEESGEDFLDFGEAVEPAGELASGMVVIKAAVEFVADVTGEAGDFSCSGHGVVRVVSTQAGELGRGMSNGFGRKGGKHQAPSSQAPEKHQAPSTKLQEAA
jgi:hypothetical protein